ncbi:5033_t:CDS:1, partial [Racocetra fulgida]
LHLTEHEIQNEALIQLENILLQQNKSLKNFPNMLYTDSVREFREFENSLINEKLNYDIDTLTEFVVQNTNRLNEDQM